MKRKYFRLLLAVLLLLTLPLCAAASTYYVVDEAGLLSEDQIADLDNSIQELRNLYGMDFVILTVDSLEGKSAQAYADDYYDYNGYGTDGEYSGMIFLLSMGEREYHLSTCGKAIDAFTDYGLGEIIDKFLPYLSDGDWYGAFRIYLDVLPEYLDAYREGYPIDIPDSHNDDYDDYDYYQDYDPDPETYWEKLGISLLVGCSVALIVIILMRGQMNTAKAKSGAAEYILDNSYRLTHQKDLFLYSRVTKTAIQQDSGSSGGGSSTHRSSSGRSHGGRGGKF